MCGGPSHCYLRVERGPAKMRVKRLARARTAKAAPAGECRPVQQPSPPGGRFRITALNPATGASIGWQLRASRSRVCKVSAVRHISGRDSECNRRPLNYHSEEQDAFVKLLRPSALKDAFDVLLD